MPERQLQEAVEELHGIVVALRELLEREYPKKSEIRRQNKKGWLIMAVLLPSMFAISFFASVTTVSYCFLGEAQDGGRPECSIIPGYASSIELGEQRIKIFEEMIDQMARNERRISRLEKQVR